MTEPRPKRNPPLEAHCHTLQRVTMYDRQGHASTELCAKNEAAIKRTVLHFCIRNRMLPCEARYMVGETECFSTTN